MVVTIRDAPSHVVGWLKTMFLTTLVFFAPLTCRGDVPKLFQLVDFTAADFAETANHFITLGENRASSLILEIASIKDKPTPPATGTVRLTWSFDGRLNESERAERLCWMCRVLYVPKNDRLLRPPRLGALRLPVLSMPDQSFPLYPLFKSGHTYFVLSEGYMVAGSQESVADYLKYCQHDGSFRNARISVPSRKTAVEDAMALRNSATWKSIKWRHDVGPMKYDLNESTGWRYILNQAAAIPQ